MEKWRVRLDWLFIDTKILLKLTNVYKLRVIVQFCVQEVADAPALEVVVDLCLV